MEAVTRALAARVREGLAAGGIDAARDPRAVRALIHRAIDAHAPDMLPTQREQVEADLMDDICGLGPLQALMDDPSVEEIWINAASRVFVARSGVAELTSLILTDEDVRALVERMLHHSGRRLDLPLRGRDARGRGAPPRRHSACHRIVVERQHPQAHPARPHPG